MGTFRTFYYSSFAILRSYWITLVPFAFYLAIQILIFSLTPISTSDDTRAYYDLSKLSLFDSHFWLHHDKPAFLALILKLFKQTFFYTVFFQWILQIISWMFLAQIISQKIKTTWLKTLGICLILGMGLSCDIVFWPKTILTESLMISCFIFWIFFFFKKAWWPMALSAVFFCGARDSGAYFILGFSFFWGIRVGLFGKNKQALKVSCLHFLIAILFMTVSNWNHRWQGAIVRTFNDRLIPNPIALCRFQQMGLQLTRSCEDPSWQYSHNAEELTDSPVFREWLYQHGKRAFMMHLLKHPREMLHPFLNRIDLFELWQTSVYPYNQVQPPYWHVLLSDNLFYPKGFALKCWLIFYFLLIFTRRKNLSERDWFSLGLFLLVIPMTGLVWHACSIEVARHSLPVKIQLRLAVLLGCLFLGDSLIEKSKKTLY